MMKDRRLKLEVSTDDLTTLTVIGDMFHALGRRTAVQYNAEALQEMKDKTVQMVSEAMEFSAEEFQYAEQCVMGLPTAPTLPVPPTLPPVAPLGGLPPAPSADLDTKGLPWDARIHSSSKEKVKDGTWRTRRGVAPELVTTVEAELRQVMAIPVGGALVAPLPPTAVELGETTAVPVPQEGVTTMLPPPIPPVAPVAPDQPQNYSGAQSGGYTPPAEAPAPAPPVAPAPAPPVAPAPAPPVAPAPVPPVAPAPVPPVAPAPAPPVAPAPVPPVAPAPVPPTLPVEAAPTMTAQPQPSVTAVVPQGDVPTTFPAFLQRMTALQNEGKLSMEQVLQVLAKHGIPNPANLNQRRDLIPTVFADLMAVVGAA